MRLVGVEMQDGLVSHPCVVVENLERCLGCRRFSKGVPAPHQAPHPRVPVPRRDVPTISDTGILHIVLWSLTQEPTKLVIGFRPQRKLPISSINSTPKGLFWQATNSTGANPALQGQPTLWLWTAIRLRVNLTHY